MEKAIEILKPCTYPNIYPYRYLVGDCGSVYDKKLNRFLKQTSTVRGYVNIKLVTEDGDSKNFNTHRIVAHEFVPGYCEETGHIQVDHNDFDKSNNDSDNLEWVTASENCKRRFKNPNNKFVPPPILKGTNHPATKYDEELIHKICMLLVETKSVIETFYAFGYKAQSENGAFYNLVRGIFQKACWKHISDIYF